MKKKPHSNLSPEVTKEEVEKIVQKTPVIFLRVSATQKDSVKEAAEALGLSVTDYLLRCHELVSSKIPTQKKGTQ